MTERRSLDSDEFVALARHFAAQSVQHTPSWAWVEAEPLRGAFAGGPVPTGYLRSSPLLLPPKKEASSADIKEICEDEIAAPAAPSRLELHIIHSAVYRVPVLLMHGHHPDGSLWSPDAVREHLVALAMRHETQTEEAGGVDGGNGEGSGVAPLSAAQISQLEHPVLRVPFCCIDPCETATLMACLLAGPVQANAPAPAEVKRGLDKLDYLSAWWSVLAPLVGAESRSAAALLSSRSNGSSCDSVRRDTRARAWTCVV